MERCCKALRDDVCFFTGHRVMSADPITAGKLLSAAIVDVINLGVKEFISGGAKGFDMLASEAVMNLFNEYPDIRLRLYLPCKEYNRAWENDSKDRMRRILDFACDIKYISDKTYRPGCMQRRNAEMVNDAKYCIAWYDNKKGGTQSTLKLAKKKNCIIRNLAIEI